MTGHRQVIRACEIGEYIYCRRAWWLRRVRELPLSGSRKLDAGIARHAEHGRAVRQAARSRYAAVLLLAAAIGLSLVGLSILLLPPH